MFQLLVSTGHNPDRVPHYPPEKLDRCYAAAVEQQALDRLFLLDALSASALAAAGNPARLSEIRESLIRQAGFR